MKAGLLPVFLKNCFDSGGNMPKLLCVYLVGLVFKPFCLALFLRQLCLQWSVLLFSPGCRGLSPLWGAFYSC